MTLGASPESALVDDPLHLEATGLQPWQLVTLVGILHDDGKEFVSVGLYVSDGDGNLDLDRSPSHGGTYQGYLATRNSMSTVYLRGSP